VSGNNDGADLEEADDADADDDGNGTAGSVAASSSYFDRLWSNSKRVRRYVLCLQKN
jgi:hypothetical protein